VEAHAQDLRAEVDDEALVTAVKTDYRTAKLDDAARALLDYAVKLTRTPEEMVEDDVVRLRNLGHSDRAILDAAEIIAYFNYINRIADGLHVDLEPEMPPRG